MLDEILNSAYEKDYADYANSLHTSLMTLIDYLESMTALRVCERRPPTSQEDSVDAQMAREPNTPATVRVQNIVECIQDFIEQISPCAIVDRDTVRNHLDLVLRRLKDVSEDMYYVREVFISTLQKKEEMTEETVSLIKNYKARNLMIQAPGETKLGIYWWSRIRKKPCPSWMSVITQVV